MDINSIFHLQCGRVMRRSISLENLLTVGTLWFSEEDKTRDVFCVSLKFSVY